MIKRYHEAPMSVFHEVQERTDGDYALVHLMSNILYRETFLEAISRGRDVILDNSIFELGTAFNAEAFNNWVQILKPRYYIVPDCWRDGPKTIRMFNDYVEQYGGPIEGRVGVAQGKTFQEVAATYRALAPRCEMIAFNFDFSEFYYAVTGNRDTDRRVAMSEGRMIMLKLLDDAGIIDHTKSHHLLGCGVPQEIKVANTFDWITSIDTCHPIMSGMTGYRYDAQDGMTAKCEFKMCDYMFENLNDTQRALIDYNLAVIENWLQVKRSAVL